MGKDRKPGTWHAASTALHSDRRDPLYPVDDNGPNQDRRPSRRGVHLPLGAFVQERRDIVSHVTQWHSIGLFCSRFRRIIYLTERLVQKLS